MPHLIVQPHNWHILRLFKAIKLKLLILPAFGAALVGVSSWYVLYRVSRSTSGLLLNTDYNNQSNTRKYISTTGAVGLSSSFLYYRNKWYNPNYNNINISLLNNNKSSGLKLNWIDKLKPRGRYYAFNILGSAIITGIGTNLMCRALFNTNRSSPQSQFYRRKLQNILYLR